MVVRFLSLFRSKTLVVQNNCESSNGQNEIFYIVTRVPLLLCFCWTSFHRLSTSTACAPLRAHTCKCVHARTKTHTHTEPKKKQNTKRVEEPRFLDAFECVFLYIMLFGAPSHHGTETGSLEQSVMWHFAEAFFFCFFCCPRLFLICKLT